MADNAAMIRNIYAAAQFAARRDKVLYDLTYQNVENLFASCGGCCSMCRQEQWPLRLVRVLPDYGFIENNVAIFCTTCIDTVGHMTFCLLYTSDAADE